MVGGSLAEFAVAPIKSTVQKPQEISSSDACCLPVAGLTALQGIRDYAGISIDGSSQANVLIPGASGGVGIYAVQIAKLAGAHVTATCGARNMDFVRSLGADEVLDYKSKEGIELISPSGRAYDAVINCTSGISWSTFKARLKPVAKVVDLTPNVKSLATTAMQKLSFCHAQELVPFILSGKAEDLQFLAELVRDGKLRTFIDSQYPLSRAEDAWARSIDGHATGKIVVTVD
ncbi:hypothetical protein KP509_33G065300 [Ceratopteris richardii]|nr:hypothetical protein KP509_33G065300 [Ceratopteris richardii]